MIRDIELVPETESSESVLVLTMGNDPTFFGSSNVSQLIFRRRLGVAMRSVVNLNDKLLIDPAFVPCMNRSSFEFVRRRLPLAVVIRNVFVDPGVDGGVLLSGVVDERLTGVGERANFEPTIVDEC